MKKLYYLPNLKKQLIICFFSFFAINSATAQFEEQTGISLPGVFLSSVAWGDYNNDGFLDILLVGRLTDIYEGYISKIYKNNGDGTFSEQTQISLTGITSGSAAWGDYNNDGLLDILLTGCWVNPYPHNVSKIYKNNGDGTFSEQTGTLLPNICGSAAWGDYNNDGHLDILLTGYSEIEGYVSKVYKNNGNETFSEQIGISLPGVSEGASTWADYNNDGFLDILLTGRTASEHLISKIYKNNGNGTFTEQTGISLPGLHGGSVAWGDYNNDGFLDILLRGDTTFGFTPITKIYKNNGDGTFSEQTGIALKGLSEGSAAWGDYNNDGLLDILLTGVEIVITGNRGVRQYISKIYKNNGDGTFSEQTGTLFNGLTVLSAFWGDYDNDGRLDVLVSAYDTITNIYTSKIFKNISSYPANTVPAAPSNLQQTVTFNTVALKWDKATDAETPQNGLSYNIRVGASPGSSNVVNPEASTSTGYRKIPALGNVDQKADGYTLNLPAGTYYWSVQAIDNAFAGGTWSTENTFTISASQASDIRVDSVSLTGMKLSWTNGNGNKRVVFMAEGNKGVTKPFDSTSYEANSTYSLETQIDTSGWYCVFNGTGNEVSVNGLKDGTSYNIEVLEYIGTTGNEEYNNSVLNGNVALIRTKQIFELQFEAPAIYSGEMVAWGDYNNDGYMDFLLTGYSQTEECVSKIYKNNGDGTFTEQTQDSLIGVMSGLSAWGDFNNDGYLDILLTGATMRQGPQAMIYKNNGDGTFTEQTGTSLTGIESTSISLGDYNNDGFLDILLTGGANINNNFQRVSKIFKNNGDWTFSEQTGISLPGVYGSAVWGDYNNDGLLDILVAGNTSFSEIGNVLTKTQTTKIFKNNGNGTFSEQSDISLVKLDEDVSATWADYNNDGHLDILLSGYLPDVGWKAVLYKNNGDGTFTEQTGISLLGGGYVAWGDYNNDGYLDVLMTGHTDTGTGIASKIYKNNSDGTFTESRIQLTGVFNSSIAWGDYDNDGLLDVLSAGDATNGPVIKVFKNIGNFKTNMPPSAPVNLEKILNPDTAKLKSIKVLNDSTYGNRIKLKWDKAVDDLTPQNGLSYNIRLGTKPGGSDVINPMASVINGYRRIPAFGNVGQTTDGYTINNLSAGTYYWSVQAIDNEFAGGAWAEEKTFTIQDTITKIQNTTLNNNTKFYPNPAKDHLTIIRVKDEQCLVTITDLNGKVVLKRQIYENEEQINISDLSSGLYLVKLQTNIEIRVLKLVIE